MRIRQEGVIFMTEQEYNPDIITVTGDDGCEHIFEELDRIEADNGKHYVALLPVYDDDEDILEGDDELFVLEVIEEDGETYLQQIEDEEELKDIGDIMYERICKKYPFLVGEDEDGEE